MSSAFSTNDTECLNRETEHNVHDATEFEQIWDQQRLNDCIQFINSQQFNKVSISFCFHFPINHHPIISNPYVTCYRFVSNFPMT